MELKVNIGYTELWELIKRMPSQQLDLLFNDIASLKGKQKNDIEPNKKKLKLLLLSGPVANDENIKLQDEARNYMEEWQIRSF